ncbi:MAG: DAK2 domain-containing protein [Thermoleophilia bacterium]|nr:DAK2 domain-containing protein [Thermoleophilia bacterium]
MGDKGATLTVSLARSLLMAGFQAIEQRKQEINDLNVYPVPDGDTGTNLALTVRAMLDAMAKLPPTLEGKDLCSAIAQAALMGARGNSGVILSQIVRGAMETLAQPGLITIDRLVAALKNASDTAYRAVRRPVEGTMLTVIKDMARAATEAPRGRGFGPFMDHVINAGWESVQRTPTLLKVLADAGVVDAGGYGLVVLVEGAASGCAEWETPIATRVTPEPALYTAGAVEEQEEASVLSKFTYCTSFLLSGQNLSASDLEQRLSSLGDSLLVVGDSSRLKVHIHTDSPGEVLSMATAIGVLTEIEIDNMKEQTAARTARLAGQSGGTKPSEIGYVDQGAVLTQVVAVVAGEGNKALFRSLGVDLIVDGGQTMNPSAEELLKAVELATAPAVVILPNNKNVIMTAEQTANLVDREIHVVLSSSIQAGLAAAVAYDRRKGGAENARAMSEALENVVSAEITRAVRATQIDGISVKAGDCIGLVEGQVVAASSDLEHVVEQVVDRLLDGTKEALTVLVGEGEDAQLAAQVVEKACARHPEVDVEVHEGGQPYYPLLLAAE